MKRHEQTEAERAEAERERLDRQEQPPLDAARDCTRCYGSGWEQIVVEGYNQTRKCDHVPIPF